ncbi:MAG TPA: hypothetical protein VGR20_12905, partial [Acidimicrobiia bacterium]|nr:hypothetical protein [Acidimicrobiia bacterium]
MLLASIAIPAARGDAAEDTVSAAQLAEGLKTIQDIAADVAAATGKDKVQAQKINEGIEPVWKKIEDTLRANDKDAYIAFEDGFEALGAAATAGDAKKAGEAADTVAATVKAYIAKYPADAPAPAPARSADAAPAPVAAAAAPAAAAPAPGEAGAAAGAGDPTLARTGRASSALAALAGAAFGVGGLAVIAGARRRRPTLCRL